MAHGAGGKATQTLVEGLLAPAFGGEALRSWPTRRVVDGLALTTDSFVVKPIRFPGGSIGELAVNGTVNDLAVAGARPLALTLSLVLEEGLAADDLRAEVEAIAARRGGRGRRGRRRRHEGRRARPLRLDVRLHDRARQARSARAALAAASLRPGDRILVSGPDRRARHRDHAGARRVRAGGRRSSRTRARSGRPSTRCSTPPARRCAACATRPAAASPRCSTSSRAPPASRWSCARRRCRCSPPVAGACEILGIDPMYVANEGVLVAFVAPEAADDALAALRVRARLRGRGGDRRGQDGPAGDGARRDRVRRPPRHGHARRRSPPAHLLDGKERGWQTVEFVPNQHATEAVTAHVIWMTVGPRLRRRLGGDDLGDEPVASRTSSAGSSRACRGWSSTPRCSRTRTAPSSCEAWYEAERGELDPFVLILEGSIPNEEINGEGHWAGDRASTRQRAADHDQRVGRPAGAEGGGGRRRRHLRHLRRHPGDEEQPDRRDGPARLPRLELEVEGRASRSSASRAARRSRTT